MTHRLYPRLAWQGITKNKRLYLPFLLTCVGMVMMTYILLSLASSPVLKTFPGGGVMPMILSMGSFVMAAFAVLFLFYTNSFLIRRRNREFGLYNILGMGKGNLARVLAWESVMMALVAIVGGEALGIALGKLFELVLVNIVGGDVQMDFTVSVPATAMTAILYLGIFALLFLRSLVTVCKTNAAALLRSEACGEKPPKANWVFGLAGFLILGAAYYIAGDDQQPPQAQREVQKMRRGERKNIAAQPPARQEQHEQHRVQRRGKRIIAHICDLLGKTLQHPIRQRVQI